MTCNTIYHVVTALYDIDMVCHGMSPKKRSDAHLNIYIKFTHKQCTINQLGSYGTQLPTDINWCWTSVQPPAAQPDQRLQSAKPPRAVTASCKLQVASSQDFPQNFVISPQFLHTLFLHVKLKYILWKNSMLSTRRKEKEMKQTKKSYTEITNQHRPSSCSLALRFTSSFCAKCKGKDIGADAATVGSIFFTTGRQRRTKYSGRTCSADSTSTCFAQSVGHGDDTKSSIYIRRCLGLFLCQRARAISKISRAISKTTQSYF